MKTKEELQEQAQAIRALEAACGIEHPTAEELNFRIAIMKRVGVALNLRELRGVAIAGPAATEQPSRSARPAPRAAAKT